MKHYGDITKINGADVEPVWIITGGSPCQDLSVAGKRAGLAGERSGLFMEQIRIIKEMREHDKSIGRSNELIRPRYMVWENVPGAFSSNGGEDFRAVLEETARVAERDAVIPGLKGKQKWTKSGCIMGDRWSIAWRVHDAQFWGVPQRKKRIALVADFGGQSAAKILFERKSLSRDPSESSKPWERTTADVKGSIRKASAVDTCYCIQGNCIDRADTAGCNSKGWRENECYTLNTIDRPAIYDARGNGDGNISPTITGDHNNRITDYTAIISTPMDSDHVPRVYRKKGHPQNAQQGQGWEETNVNDTLNNNDNTDGHTPTLIIEPSVYRNNAYDQWEQSQIGSTQRASGGVYGGGSENLVSQSTVRRLTPLECERLQGYPDHWTNIGNWIDSKGKLHKGDADSPRYKALGNSIALPFWSWMATRMCALLRDNGTRDLTMASLFDGIGGFPLVFKRCGCKPVWASEIEEFPIAVTKIRFPEYD